MLLLEPGILDPGADVGAVATDGILEGGPLLETVLLGVVRFVELLPLEFALAEALGGLPEELLGSDLDGCK